MVSSKKCAAAENKDQRRSHLLHCFLCNLAQKKDSSVIKSVKKVDLK